MTPEFLLTFPVMVASLGTGAVYTVAAGLAYGGRASVAAALSYVLGIVHMLTALIGLPALLQASAIVLGW